MGALGAPIYFFGFDLCQNQIHLPPVLLGHKPRIELRREAPQLDYWVCVLLPSQYQNRHRKPRISVAALRAATSNF